MPEQPIEPAPRSNTALPLSRASTVVGYGVGKTAFNLAWPLVRIAADTIYRIGMEVVARPGLALARGFGNLTVAVGFQLPTYVLYNLFGRLPYYIAIKPALMAARAVLPKRGDAINQLMQNLDDKYKSFKTYWQSTRVYTGWQTAKKHMNVKSLEHFIHDFFDARMEGVFKWGNSLSPNYALLALVVCFGIFAPLSPAAGILLHGYSFPWFMPDWLAAGAHAALPLLKSAALGTYHFGQALWAAPLPTLSAALTSGVGALQTALPGLLASAQSFGANLLAAPLPTLASLLPSIATVKMVAFEAVKLPVLLTGFVVTNVCATFFPKAKLLLPAVFAACANQASKSPFGGKQLAAWLNHTHKLDVVHDVKKDMSFANNHIVKPWTGHTLLGLSVLATALTAPSFIWVPVAAYAAAKTAHTFILSPIAKSQRWQSMAAATRQATARAGNAVISVLERIPLMGRGVTYVKGRAIHIAQDDNVVDKLAHVIAPFAEKSSAQYWERRLGKSAMSASAIVSPATTSPTTSLIAVSPAATATENQSTTKSLMETLVVYGTSATAPLLTLLAAKTAFKVDDALSHALSSMAGGHEVAALFSGILAVAVGVATFASTTSIANKLPNWLFRPAAAEATVNPSKIDNARGAVIVEGLAAGTIGLAAVALGAPIPLVVGAVASWALPTLIKGTRQVMSAHRPERSEPTTAQAALPARMPG